MSALHAPIGQWEVLPEPLIGCSNQTREVPLNILDVVQLGRERIPNVDDKNFPVGLTLIEQSHDTENLDLLNLADVANLFTNLTNVQGIIITLSLRLGMSLSRVFPSLWHAVDW